MGNGNYEGLVSRGAGFARNRAIDLRKRQGTYCDNSTPNRFLAMLDSDDRINPTRIAAQLQYMMSLDPDIVNGLYLDVLLNEILQIRQGTTPAGPIH